MVWSVWVGLWVQVVSLKTRNATPYSYSSSSAEYFSMICYERYCIRTAVGRTLKATPSSGHIFYARSCVSRDFPSEAMLYLLVLKVVTRLGYRGKFNTFP